MYTRKANILYNLAGCFEGIFVETLLEANIRHAMPVYNTCGIHISLLAV